MLRLSFSTSSRPTLVQEKIAQIPRSEDRWFHRSGSYLRPGDGLLFPTGVSVQTSPEPCATLWPRVKAWGWYSPVWLALRRAARQLHGSQRPGRFPWLRLAPDRAMPAPDPYAGIRKA